MCSGSEAGSYLRLIDFCIGARAPDSPTAPLGEVFFFFFFFTLGTGPSRSLSLKLSDTRVYEPQLKALSNGVQDKWDTYQRNRGFVLQTSTDLAAREVALEVDFQNKRPPDFPESEELEQKCEVVPSRARI